ncbi:MAG: hypothetical protein WC734_03090 [Patescibacteria group bacterium]|jgi:hypothetical protein
MKKVSLFTRSLIALGVFAVLTVAVTDYVLADNIELQSRVVEGKYLPTVDCFVSRPIIGTLGWSGFFLTCGGWGEAYVGPTYSPASWLTLSGSLGVETDPQQTRVATSIWAGNDAGSIIFIYEDGGSGPWTKLVATHSVVSIGGYNLGAGVHGQRFLGYGPQITIKKGEKGKLGLWASNLMLDGAKPTQVIGIKLDY